MKQGIKDPAAELKKFSDPWAALERYIPWQGGVQAVPSKPANQPAPTEPATTPAR